MPDRSSTVLCAAGRLTLHLLGVVAGVAAIVFLRAYGERSGIGGVQLVLVAALALAALRIIPSVHRAVEDAKHPTSYRFQVAAIVTGALLVFGFAAFGSFDAVAGLVASLIFWNGWLPMLKGLIPLKGAGAALKPKNIPRGAASA